MLLYDNLEDTQAKLQGTICYYDGNAVLVREVTAADEEHNKPYNLLMQSKNDRNYLKASIDDKKFDFRHYNIGYANHGGVAVWWCRKPLKQYRQGLRADQMHQRISRPNDYSRIRWEFSNAITAMLENKYPTIRTCEKTLKDGDAEIMAFHKDIAMSYDRIHSDFILEHRGLIVGQTLDFKNFSLLEEYGHLREVIKEAFK